MARQFSGTSDLTASGVPVTTDPLTLACWFNASDVTSNHRLLRIRDTAADQFRISARGDVAGDPVRVFVDTGASGGAADTSTGYSANTWHHACGVIPSSSQRKVYIDGGSEGTGGGNRAVDITANQQTQINEGTATSVKVAEAAIWNAALAVAEIEQLAAGVCPLLVRPQNLVAYWPLLGGDLNDWVGGYHFTASGTSVTDHPDRLLVYPSPAIISTPAAAAPPAAPTPMMFHSF